MTNLDSILKSRDITLSTKVHIVKAMVFPVVMYGCESWTIKKAENWCLQTVVLEKTLENHLDSKEIKPVNPKYSLEGLIKELKFQYFGHLMWRVDSLENTMILGKMEDRRRREQQRMRCLDAIMTQWIWVWSNAGKLWSTRKPGVQHSTVSQRVQHNWVTEQQHC